MDQNVINIKVVANDLASNVFKGINISANDLANNLGSNLKQGLNDIIDKIKHLTFIAGGAAAAFGGFGIKTAMDLEQVSVALTTMLGSSEEAEKLLANLADFAAQTPFELTGLQKSTKGLLAYGFATEEVIPNLKMIGDVASGVSTSVDDITKVFGRAKNMGILQRFELQMLMDRGIPMLRELAIVTGAGEDAILSMATAGEISFEHLQQAFHNMTTGSGDFADNMAKQSKTAGGLLSNLKDNITILALELVGVSKTGVIEPGGIFDQFKTILKNVLKFLENNKDAIIDFVKKGLSKLKDIIEDIMPLFRGIIGLFTDGDENAKQFRNTLILIVGTVTALSIAFGILSSPIFMVTTLILALAAAVTFADDIAEILFSGMAYWINLVKDYLDLLVQSFLIGFEIIKQSIIVPVTIAFEIIRGIIETFIAILQGDGDRIGEIWDGVGSNISDAITEAVENIGGKIEQFVEDGKVWLEELLKPLRDAQDLIQSTSLVFGSTEKATAQRQAESAELAQTGKVTRNGVSMTPEQMRILGGGFADGGIIGGSSYSGDRVMARVNSGEMILNKSQQQNLFEMINKGGGGSQNVTINVNGGDTQRIVQVIEDVLARQNLNASRGLSLALN